MGLVNLILAGVKLLQAVISAVVQKQLLDAGAKAQLADTLLATAGMVADAKQISDWVAKQPPHVVSRILRDNYTRD